MKYTVLLEESDEGFAVSVPGLPGCHSQGETREEALTNIREAAELWLEVAAERAADQARADGARSELREIEL